MTKKHIRLMAIGMLLVSGDFIIGRFVALPDFWIGLLKGAGIALMLKSLYMGSRQKPSSC